MIDVLAIDELGVHLSLPSRQIESLFRDLIPCGVVMFEPVLINRSGCGLRHPSQSIIIPLADLITIPLSAEWA